MQTLALKLDSVDASPATERRAEELLGSAQNELYVRTDRLFAKLMVFQWLAGIAAAEWISPRTWIGASSQVHLHVWAAVFLGGAITSFPVWLAWKQPGRELTRYSIAIGQMLTSSLLIHLSGGRIETHFHVFGSLAFLAFYRDWRVLVSATVVVAADHFLRGLFWPQSVFGVLTASSWRWLEHAGWVIFEDFFLLIAIQQGLREMRLVAERQAALEALNESIELRVIERTRELELEILERKEAEAQLEVAHKQLVDTSRRAGMAEVATGVLHNIGNVLNSVNISATLVFDRLRESRVTVLAKTAAKMREHGADLKTFLFEDPKGRLVPDYLMKLADHLAVEREKLLLEMTDLNKNITHIKDVVAMQQTHAGAAGIIERMQVVSLVEDALLLNNSSFGRHHIEVVRQFQDVPPVTIDKHKVLQILVNLASNAKHALEASDRRDRRLTLGISANGDNRVKIVVSDNGIGIPPENLTRIFSHGFTTKRKGHGFGLHSAANAAKEMGGSLTAQSAGAGSGATFTLELPMAKNGV
jgi:signal transduction histidine kinase